MPSSDSLSVARTALAAARSILVTAGAGMGVDSGLPDFRGTQGFWKAYPPLAKLGLSFAEVANPRWFEADPALAWGFYGHRLGLYRETKPHYGFDWLREAALSIADNCFAVTSNVDGHFRMAGFPEERLLEIHGSIHRLQCSRPCTRRVWSADSVQIRIDPDTLRAMPPFPSCPHCGGIARPNILMFEDSRWIESEMAIRHRAFNEWLGGKASRPMCIIECGAGTAIPSIRMLSERVARLPHTTLIRINPRDFGVPPGAVALAEGALAGLRRLFGKSGV